MPWLPNLQWRCLPQYHPWTWREGVGDTAIRNYQAWQTVRVVMDTLCEKGKRIPVCPCLDILLPILFAGPVGAVAMHYSDKYNDVTYNAQLVPGCAGVRYPCFYGRRHGRGSHARGHGRHQGLPRCGHSDGETLEHADDRGKMDLVKASGALAVAMDVDAAGLPFLKICAACWQQIGGRNERNHRPHGRAFHRQGHHERQRSRQRPPKRALRLSSFPTTGDASWTRALLRPKSCRKSRLLWAARSKSLLTAGSVPALMFSRLLPWAPMPSLLPDLLSMLFYGGGKEGVRCLVDKLGAELKGYDGNVRGSYAP